MDIKKKSASFAVTRSLPTLNLIGGLRIFFHSDIKYVFTKC